MSERNNKQISVEEAQRMLEKSGCKVTVREVEAILNFLIKIAEIIIANDMIKP